MDMMYLLLVDDCNHASLAMLSLRAVKPHRSSIVDHDCVSWRGSCRSSHWHESRVNTSDIRIHGDGLAGRIKGGLSDSVVCWCKLELNHISYCSLDIVGREGQRSVRASNFHYVNSDSRTSCCSRSC